jgi:hypothetical protein
MDWLPIKIPQGAADVGLIGGRNGTAVEVIHAG